MEYTYHATKDDQLELYKILYRNTQRWNSKKIIVLIIYFLLACVGFYYSRYRYYFYVHRDLVALRIVSIISFIVIALIILFHYIIIALTKKKTEGLLPETVTVNISDSKIIKNDFELKVEMIDKIFLVDKFVVIKIAKGASKKASFLAISVPENKDALLETLKDKNFPEIIIKDSLDLKKDLL